MRDIILIPTYKRPEYLAVCLQHIMAAPSNVQRCIFVQHDFHVGDSTQDMNDSRWIATFLDDCSAFSILQTHTRQGNSFNCFSLYRKALALPDVRYIYLIEDDVIVASDFFRWHEAVNARVDYFSTIGWKCLRNPEVKMIEDQKAYIESARDYASIGVCWKPSRLAEFIQHDVDSYYQNQSHYLAAAFPGSPIPSWQWTEQDGIVMRMMAENKGRLNAWPVVPRCAHIGVQGYHRQGGHKFTGSLSDRIGKLQLAIIDGMDKLVTDPFNDIFSLPKIQPWDEKDLWISQRFGI